VKIGCLWIAVLAFHFLQGHRKVHDFRAAVGQLDGESREPEHVPQSVGNPDVPSMLEQNLDYKPRKPKLGGAPRQITPGDEEGKDK
jgi:hypothetical protein